MRNFSARIALLSLVFALLPPLTHAQGDPGITLVELPLFDNTRLSGDQEVPPVETRGRGRGIFFWRNGKLRYHIVVWRLSSPITAAHFHRAPAGQNGPVVRTITFHRRQAKGTLDDLTEDEIEGLLNGEFYVNVHTEDHPPGEVRGQIDLH